jgi:NDP-mannose synthase
LMRHHVENGAALTVGTHYKDVSLALGVVEGDSGAVTGYVEKPTLHYEVSMGIYAYSPEALGHVPHSHFDFPDLVLALLAASEPVASYHYDGAWFDIGTPAEHEAAVAAYEANPALFEPDR